MGGSCWAGKDSIPRPDHLQAPRFEDNVESKKLGGGGGGGSCRALSNRARATPIREELITGPGHEDHLRLPYREQWV